VSASAVSPSDIVTVIQARQRSTRLPGKILLPLGAATVLEQQIERVCAAALVGTVVVATTTDQSDDPIERICELAEVACIRGHPTDLLDRHRQAAVAYDAEHVVKIPSDCPLIDPAVIDEVLELYVHRACHFDYVSNLHPATQPDGFDVEIFSREALESAWREARAPHEREHTTPFIWDQPERFRIGNVSRTDGNDYSRSHRVVLDYPADFLVIARVFTDLHSANPLFTVDDVVRWLDAHPATAGLNAPYHGVNWYRHHVGALRTISSADTRPFLEVAR